MNNNKALKKCCTSLVIKKTKQLSTYPRNGEAEDFKNKRWGFPGSPVAENLPCNARDTSSSPDFRRSHMPWSN